jgi:DNA-directed RNA polymerase subunit RPC12/RpoP
MAIETLGEAMDFSWRVTVRCADGPRDGMKRVRDCVYGGELDLNTLVWTRGRDFPLARLENRLKCPRCGSRRVRLAFSVPPSSRQIRA